MNSKLVGAITAACNSVAYNIFDNVIDTDVPVNVYVPPPRVAENVKLADDTVKI